MKDLSLWRPSAGTLVLLLPGLLELSHKNELSASKALITVLARARKKALPVNCAEQAVLALLGREATGQDALPAALCQYVADFNETPGQVVCADPVWLKADADAARLFSTDSMEFSDEESHRLLESLNNHFAEEGLLFVEGVRRRWYLCGIDGSNLLTLPTAAVAGRNVSSFLPTSEQSRRWRQLTVEVQMLLHDHEVNRAREARGQSPVNSIWFWGGHALPASNAVDSKATSSVAAKLFADDGFCRGFGRLASVTVFPTAEALAGIHQHELSIVSHRGFERSVVSGDIELAREGLSYTEKLLKRVLQLLWAGKLREIQLVPGNGEVHALKRLDLLRFWASYSHPGNSTGPDNLPNPRS